MKVGEKEKARSYKKKVLWKIKKHVCGEGPTQAKRKVR